jgi:membrane protease YdiL (CAAX protease family)
VHLIRQKDGEIRLIWKLMIIIGLFVALAVLLRFIPISLYSWYLVSGGLDQQAALATAKTTIFEDPVWSTILSILNGLISLPLVWFLLVKVEKRTFAWKDIGLDWRPNSLSRLLFGLLLAVLMYGANMALGQALGSFRPPLSTVWVGLSIFTVIQNLALYLPMGFGEEVVFRGYVQSRLVQRLGAIWGILIATVLFTTLHLGFYELSPLATLSGIILFAMVGTLYHWTKSLYLVGMFHGISNTLLNTLPFEGTDTSGLIVHAATLLLVVIAVLRSKSSARL